MVGILDIYSGVYIDTVIVSMVVYRPVQMEYSGL